MERPAGTNRSDSPKSCLTVLSVSAPTERKGMYVVGGKGVRVALKAAEGADDSMAAPSSWAADAVTVARARRREKNMLADERPELRLRGRVGRS